MGILERFGYKRSRNETRQPLYSEPKYVWRKKKQKARKLLSDVLNKVSLSPELSPDSHDRKIIEILLTARLSEIEIRSRQKVLRSITDGYCEEIKRHATWRLHQASGSGTDSIIYLEAAYQVALALVKVDALTLNHNSYLMLLKSQVPGPLGALAITRGRIARNLEF